MLNTVLLFLVVLLLPIPSGAEEQPPKQGEQQGCVSKCTGLGTQCDSHCRLSADVGSCQGACDSVFNAPKGFCQGRCADEGFLRPCDGVDAGEALEDDCIYSCESHYSDCVMACRAGPEAGSQKIMACYKNCAVIFTEEEGLCRFQCATDPGFMENCPDGADSR